MSGLSYVLGPISASHRHRWEMDLRFQEGETVIALRRKYIRKSHILMRDRPMTFLKTTATALIGASLIALSACSGGTESPKAEAPKKAEAKAPVTLAEVLAHPRRLSGRHP